ncbi:MAG: DUF3784 domain-containing protein [Clostridia bacterium]|nr:DUF3784 domain-containing protein [Clostridia bacterium]
MNELCIGMGFVFLFFGILIFVGKGDYLFPELKRAKKQNGKIKVKRLCRNIGIMIILGSAVLITAGFWQTFREKALFISMTIWIVLCVADVIYIAKSRRYKNDKD